MTDSPETVADEAFSHRFEKEAFWDDLGENLLAGLFTHVATSKEMQSRALGDAVTSWPLTIFLSP